MAQKKRKVVRAKATQKQSQQRMKVDSLNLTDILSRIEIEAEKVVRRLVERAEYSSRGLKKGIATLIDQIREEGLATVANEKKEDFRRMAEEVISRAKEIQVLALGNLNRDEIIREAKKNLGELIGKVSTSDLAAKARVRAHTTKAQFLSILSIPTQTDVVKLSKKISNLETRVSKFTRKAAA